MASITSLPSGVSGSSLVLISEQTASSSATISFTSGIDSTYKEYIFKFTNIHPATDNVDFTFNMSVDGGSNYNVTKTTTLFQSQHKEDDSKTELAYEAGQDLAQGTGFQNLSRQVGNENDENCSGFLCLFNPSSTTFVKHFIGKMNASVADPKSENSFTAGYGNTTSAVDAVQFKFGSGNIDSGTIKMYGVV
jgi:hypothetical protein